MKVLEAERPGAVNTTWRGTAREWENVVMLLGVLPTLPDGGCPRRGI